ncbi:MHS family MFS transporter [Saccharopolyspora sp. K220]|uniref:MFS transporter n=1 Tax=Saccharopolyspora soli TaxID=2926618 RepID=UPI001F5711B7|nr:MFS transporter [Saccharopolyspora soli]MCI2417876.1 MHS family MFS transporter [Saccharopolyspora soli]
MTRDNGVRERKGASPRAVSAAALVGSTIEWYDFMVFGTAAALVFNKLFFPAFSPLAGTLASFATFWAGFLARPIGGVLFGHFGDRIGRKSMLVLTLLLMGAATFCMGILPTYQQVGIWAPVLLVLMRLLQGLGLGGEWGGAALMTVEHAPPRKRGFYGSFTQVGGSLGQVLASGSIGAVAMLPEDQLMSWGWRIPFLLSALLIVVGLVIRLRIVESPVFLEYKQQERGAEKPPVVEVLRSQPGNVIRAACSAFANNAIIYVVTVFTLSYAAAQLGLSEGVMLSAVVIASLVDAFAIPLWGALSDRIGRRPVILGSAVAMVLFAFPFFWLLETGSTPLICLAFTVAIAGIRAALYAPQPAYFSELFATGVRYSGASLGTNLATVAMGGTAPFIATALLGWSGGASWPVSVYLMVVALITFSAVLVSPETLNTSIGAKAGKSAGSGIPSATS